MEGSCSTGQSPQRAVVPVEEEEEEEYSILFYFILFYSILFYSILFYSILFYSILVYYQPFLPLPRNAFCVVC
jgi:hypothetical protein